MIIHSLETRLSSIWLERWKWIDLRNRILFISTYSVWLWLTLWWKEAWTNASNKYFLHINLIYEMYHRFKKCNNWDFLISKWGLSKKDKSFITNISYFRNVQQHFFHYLIQNAFFQFSFYFDSFSDKNKVLLDFKWIYHIACSMKDIFVL